MKRLIITTVAAFILSGCATPEPLHKHTMSGKPEGVYPGSTVEKVKAKILFNCNNNGFMTTSDANSVTCSNTMSGVSGAMTQVLLGNQYSTPPVLYEKFTIGEQPGQIKVWDDMWIETQMAFGQVRSMRVTNTHAINESQDALDNLNP